MSQVKQKITLEEVLAAKEERYNRQQIWLKRFGLPLVSITVNMPGSIKDPVMTGALCDYAEREIKRRLPVLAAKMLQKTTGAEALLAVQGEAAQIKAVCCEIEAEHSFGRLLDIDVFSATGEPISGQETRGLRSCYVCKRPAVVCMREKAHSQEEIGRAVGRLWNEFLAFRSQMCSTLATKLGTLAVEAMLYEVSCTPSPGLVNRFNSGAHQDMDFYSFMTSTAALGPFMARFVQVGIDFIGTATEMLPVLRIVGQEAEQAMFTATAGINTQKGLIFSLGIVAAAIGRLLKAGNYQESGVYQMVAAMTDGIVARELAGRSHVSDDRLTAGERLYRKYQISGIRGELEQGLPTVEQYGLPQLRRSMGANLSLNDALLETLLRLMTCVEDTTVMNRHSPQVMRQWVKEQVEAVFAVGAMQTTAGRTRLARMDQEFVERRISPGGAADLLAVTWFIYRVSQEVRKKF